MQNGGAIDDTALRLAARDLLKAAREQVPMIAFAAHAAEENRGKLLVEVAFDGAAVTTTVLFDRGGSEQTVLLEIGKT